MSERNDLFLLQDIAEAIQNIFDFIEAFSFEGYTNDVKTKHAVEHNFMIIGEAVSRVSDECKKGNNHINWRQIKDFRNVIVHDYFGIDNSIVWDIIKLNLPELLQQIVLLIDKKTPE